MTAFFLNLIIAFSHLIPSPFAISTTAGQKGSAVSCVLLILSLTSFSLVSSSATGSRRLTNASPPLVIPKDISDVICSYLTYTDQYKSFLGIDRRSYQTVHDLNEETIQRFIDSKNELMSLLREPASVRQTADIFKLHRDMMLDEQHALQWMDIRQIFQWNLDRQMREPLISQQLDFEFGRMQFGASYLEKGQSLQSVYPEYQSPYNLVTFKALREEQKSLIDYSRDITQALYLGQHPPLLSTIYYVISWEELHSVNLLPRRIDVYDDEAIRSDTNQMRELRRLITECGLNVIHPKDIAAAMNPNQSGITAIFIRNPPIAHIQEGGISRHVLLARWILGIFNKMHPQQWDSLVQNRDDITFILKIYYGALWSGDDNLIQSVKDRFNEWFGESHLPRDVRGFLDAKLVTKQVDVRVQVAMELPQEQPKGSHQFWPRIRSRNGAIISIFILGISGLIMSLAVVHFLML